MRFPFFPALGFLALANAAFAGVGMGDLEVRSFKGEPLKAEVRIVASSPNELAGAQAVLASRRVMEGYKPIRREWDYGDNFSYEIARVGQDYLLKINSSKPIRVDTLDVTLGLRYNGGDLYKDFALPMKERPAIAPAAPVIAPPASVATAQGGAEAPKLPEARSPVPQPVAVKPQPVSVPQPPVIPLPEASVKTVEAEKTLPPPPASPRRTAPLPTRQTEKAVPSGSKLISLD